jgi:hypothetical protein
MEKKKYTFIEPSKATTFPDPRTLTSEEEAEILKAYIEQIDPAELEAECQEALRLMELGQLVSMEQVLEEIKHEETSPLTREEKRASA